MPLIRRSPYVPPRWLPGKHLQTIYPPIFRRFPHFILARERLELEDGDFLDLDWSRVASSRAALLVHGLEGTASAAYMIGMARALNRRGWDAALLNLRGCSGFMNRLARSYHGGETGDIDAAVQHLFAKGDYTDIALIGFSLGGNLVLKYAGEQGRQLDPRIFALAGISVPLDLESCVDEIQRPGNFLYHISLMRKMRRRLREKAKLFPDELDLARINRLNSIRAFDEYYTAPIHGYPDAHTYWSENSSLRFLRRIARPTYLLQARNDPLLSPACYPLDVAGRLDHLHLETPKQGGHMGFPLPGKQSEYYHEIRVMAFLEEVLEG